jgi:hypothetical protein
MISIIGWRARNTHALRKTKMTIDQTALINHVWTACLNSSDGRAFFNATHLSKNFLGSEANHADVLKVLHNLPDINCRYFIPYGSEELGGKILEAAISEVYCTDSYRHINQVLNGNIDDSRTKYLSGFFSELKESLL